MSRQSFRTQPGQPKPYDFVPLPAETRRLEILGHDRLAQDHYSGELGFTVYMLSPVFVSNGRYELSERLNLGRDLVVRGFYRCNGLPVIPASSLKGVVRSIAEAISPSCIATTRVDARKLPVPDAANTRKCRIGAGKESCPACALFGAGGNNAHIGLVSFRDAAPEGALQTEILRLMPLYGPRVTYRQTPRVYLDGRGNFKGRKFFYHSLLEEDAQGDRCEVLPAGASLVGSLTFVNLDERLLGILGFALGADGSFKHKLGGGKPLALGSIALDLHTLRLATKDAFLQAEPAPQTLTGNAVAAFFAERIAAAEQSGWLLPLQMQKLREILHYPTTRRGITGLY